MARSNHRKTDLLVLLAPPLAPKTQKRDAVGAATNAMGAMYYDGWGAKPYFGCGGTDMNDDSTGRDFEDLCKFIRVGSPGSKVLKEFLLNNIGIACANHRTNRVTFS